MSDPVNTGAYPIPAAPVSSTEEIKKSRFITDLVHAPSVQAAKDFVQHTRLKHPTARHHCWGFVAGAPCDSQCLGFSDDGEPSGTAGKPILAQLTGSGIGEICAVVTRYSGGIKLGTGGLVKAYGGGVQQALKLLQTEIRKDLVNLDIDCPYSLQTSIEQCIKTADGQLVQADYHSEGVHLTVAVERHLVASFSEHVTNVSHGSVTVQSPDSRARTI